jgi:hypothetical protein
MKTFAALAAVAAVCAIAAPASAATFVRIPVAQKTTAQLDAEIQAAAQSVCAAEHSASVQDCVTGTLLDANRQLTGILKARTSPKAPARAEAVTVVRVSLKGKTLDQVHAEIRQAAQTVCKSARDNFSSVAYSACVTDAVRSAKAQLQAANVRSDVAA